MKNTFGSAVSMTIFGESHGPALGAVLDGLAAGLPVDEAAIAAALELAGKTKGAPTVILARTVKGKGVSFMENDPGWHGKAPNDEQYNQARAELLAGMDALAGPDGLAAAERDAAAYLGKKEGN